MVSIMGKPALVCGVVLEVMSLGNYVVMETIFVCESDYLGRGIPRIIN